MTLYFRQDSPLVTPYESAFHRTPPLGDFALSLKWKNLDGRAVTLVNFGDAHGWPHAFLNARPKQFFFGRHVEGSGWHVTECPLNDRLPWQCLHVNCFNGRFEAFVNSVRLGGPPFDMPFDKAVETWSVGTTPYMHGSCVYGDARIWDVELRSAPYFAPAANDANVLLNFGVLDAYEHDIAQRADPALLKLDVDDLTAYRTGRGWPDATAQVDALYALAKAVAQRHSTSAVPARSHYKGVGNDELVVLCNGAEAQTIAQAIQQELAVTALPECAAGALKVSIGIGRHGPPFSVLYALAGIALVRAKQDGKNCIRECQSLDNP